MGFSFFKGALDRAFRYRPAGAGSSVSVYEDKIGTDESIRGAPDWIAKSASSTTVAPPTVSEGTVMLHLK